MIFRKIFNFFVYLFAIAGFVLIGGYFSIRFGLTNVSGVVDANNSFFEQSAEKIQAQAELQKNPQVLGDSTIDLNQEIERLQNIKNIRAENYCKIRVIGQYFPINAQKIVETGQKTNSDPLISKMVAAIELRISGNDSLSSELVKCEQDQVSSNIDLTSLKKNFSSVQSADVFSWIGTPEWQALKLAAVKDKPVIDRVAGITGLEPRLIVSDMIVEQLRVFNSEREVFKKFFEPLKILCSANKISLGIMGVKENTAEQVEKNLKDTSSPFYLGKEYENLLDYGSANVGQERYNRLTDNKDHYFSYLYGALYLRQMMKQWKDAGYDMQYRPEIVGTLFNVGFPQSKPKPNPQVGGSKITAGGQSYSFGSLAYEFYYSGELADDFPYQID